MEVIKYRHRSVKFVHSLINVHLCDPKYNEFMLYNIITISLLLSLNAIQRQLTVTAVYQFNAGYNLGNI